LSLENHLDSLRFGFQRLPQAVHRLDRDTSGCLLLSRNPKAHARLQQAFEAGAVGKRYLAVLEGVLNGEAGEIDLALAKVSTAEAGWRMVPDAGGKRAVTAWRLIEAKDGRSLVEFRPATGRTHQIRVHAASGLGAPVVGDPVYGRADRAGMMLHAASLSVPRAGKPPVEAEAPLPERFALLGFGASDAAP
jgi:tRNA pseudouridine32 synthase/23S rRNA pseudouridine746 synthase